MNVSAKRCAAFLGALILIAATSARAANPFSPLSDLLPAPNEVRTASGAPGPAYWQQRADYTIAVELDAEQQRLTGTNDINYHNHSPHTLKYLWVVLDQNRYAKDSVAYLTRSAPAAGEISMDFLATHLAQEQAVGGFKLNSVALPNGAALRHSVFGATMRIDLDEPLAPGKSFRFRIGFEYRLRPNAIDTDAVDRHGGYIRLADGNYLYGMTHWYPRMAPYTDVDGWPHVPYLGAGDFSLEFGTFNVAITVPGNFIVAAGGALTNPRDVLSASQAARYERAASATQPVAIVTAEEAKANRMGRAQARRTWHFTAENVRDFAFGTSRAFLWDAQGYQQVGDGRSILVQSFRAEESRAVWDADAIEAVIRTLRVASEVAFDYPWPVAVTVAGPGMESSLIAFNGMGGWPDRNEMLSVMVHEAAHWYFPMIVNSDERQWAWMDEGLATYLEARVLEAWPQSGGQPTWRNRPAVATFMGSSGRVPVMTQPDATPVLWMNAYAKVGVALDVLRDVVLGPERFDFAMREYARRWHFKRPQPADFFRTMEDASGVDLDWFWRGWFFTTDHVDLGIENVSREVLNDRNRAVYEQLVRTHADPLVAPQLKPGAILYSVDIVNRGGLVMPVLLDVEYTDGSHEELVIPAQIWRYDPRRASKVLVRDKAIRSITLDARRLTPDADRSNDRFAGPIVERPLLATESRVVQ